jgi:hypothetical protein
MAAVALLCLTTSNVIFSVPTPVSAATVFLDSLLVIPGVQMVEPGRE